MATIPTTASVKYSGIPDDVALRNSVMAIVDTYGCMTDFNAMKVFFASPANISGIKAAVDKYGLPPANTPSYHTFMKWHDFCDWDKGMARFYYYAKYAMTYPVLNASTANCDIINGMIIALEMEKKAIDENYVNDNKGDVHTGSVAAVSDIEAAYNAIYANMNCDKYLADVAAKKIADEQAAALAASQASQLATYQATSTTSGGGSKIAIYIAVGVAALIGIMVVGKMLKK